MTSVFVLSFVSTQVILVIFKKNLALKTLHSHSARSAKTRKKLDEFPPRGVADLSLCEDHIPLSLEYLLWEKKLVNS